MKLGLIQCGIKCPESLESLLFLYQGLEADLAVAPELVITGNEIPSSEEVLRRLRMLQEAVKRKGLPLLAGGTDPAGPWNAVFLITPEKIRLITKKINLFPAFDLKVGMRPGKDLAPFRIHGQTLGVVICFDLRFPELTRSLVNRGAQIILVPAAWPQERIAHFHALLKARAIENQVFVCGLNAVGEIEGFHLAGESVLFDPWGRELIKISGQKAQVVEIDLALLNQARCLFVTSRWSPPFSPETKFLPLEELIEEIEARRSLGQKMVFTNGCFDLLHAGHVDYLFQARREGDFLVVGLNSDQSVRRLKGPDRPINTQQRRALVLAGLSAVDYVVLFEEDTPEKLIKTLRPDVLVKGADWPEEKIVGADFVKSLGGRVVRIPFRYQVSTSRLIEEIKHAP